MSPVIQNAKRRPRHYTYIFLVVSAAIIILLLLVYRKATREDQGNAPNNQSSQREPTPEEARKSISAPENQNPQPIPKEILDTLTASQKKGKPTNTASISDQNNPDPEVLKSLTATSK